MMRHCLGGLVLLLCSASASFAAPADSTHAVTDAATLARQVADAYGGRAALEQVKAYRMDGTVDAGPQRGSGPMSRLFQRPGRLRVDLRYPDHTETRVVAGEIGWRANGDKVTAANGMMLDAMMLQAVRADLPLFLLAHLDSVRAIDPLERDSLRLDGLEVAVGEGHSLRAYVDPATHLIRVSQSLLGASDSSTQFETDYSDFRKVGRVRFAFHEENSASGMPTGTMTMERVTLNPKLGARDFGEPRTK